jgi:parallel beta-helix repeat protein
MTVLSTVTVDYTLDPRLAEVAAGVDGVNVQDSHDTLTGIEDGVEGHNFPNLVKTAGGENLGGGTTVGLTTTLQNVQYVPKRSDSVVTGSATATDATGATLTDGSADYVTAAVKRGDWIVNFTDLCVTEIIAVTDLNNLVIRIPSDGSNNFFTSGDSYKIYDVQEFNLEGGNFVAIDNLAADLNPVFPSFGRFISKASASSATTANQAQLEHGTFGNVVTIEVGGATAVSGTVYPAGTPSSPSDNIADAHTILLARGLKRFKVLASMTLSTENFSEGVTFEGLSAILTTLTIDPATDVTNCIFERFTILGTLDNGNRLDHCIVNGVTSFDGVIENCALEIGGVTLGGSTNTLLVNCVSETDDVPVVTIGTGSALSVRGYRGTLCLAGKTGTDDCSVDMDSGRVVLDVTNVAGEISLYGNAEITNNVDPTLCYVRDFMAHNTDTATLKQLIEALRPHHTGFGKMIFWNSYDGDDTHDGDHLNRATKTFAQAHNLATDNGHDIIIAVSGNPAGVTVSNENITISKNYLFLRGAGRDFNLHSTNDSLSCVNITGNGSEVSGMVLSTELTSTKNCVEVTGDFPLLQNLYCDDSVDAIYITGSSYPTIDNCRISGNSGYGIKVDGAAEHVTISGTHVGSNGGNGIEVALVAGHEVIIGDCIIHENTGYGIDIAATAVDTIIKSDVVIEGNTAGSVNDLSSSTVDLTGWETKVEELHELQGLEAGNPMTITPSARTTTNLSLVLTGDGVTTKTVTRS